MVNIYIVIIGMIILFPIWAFIIYLFMKETLRFASPYLKSSLLWILSSLIFYTLSLAFFQIILFIIPQPYTSILWIAHQLLAFTAAILFLISAKKLSKV
jgi:hypothetical protein